MSTKTTPYYTKREAGTQMYGPSPKIPKYPNNPDARQIRDRYGDCTPVVKYRMDENGKSTPVRRSET